MSHFLGPDGTTPNLWIAGRQRRFCWSSLRYAYGHYVYWLAPSSELLKRWEWETSKRSIARMAAEQERERWTRLCNVAVPRGRLSANEAAMVSDRLKAVAGVMQAAPWPFSELSVQEALETEARRWKALLCDIQAISENFTDETCHKVLERLRRTAERFEANGPLEDLP